MGIRDRYILAAQWEVIESEISTVGAVAPKLSDLSHCAIVRTVIGKSSDLILFIDRPCTEKTFWL
jgi:hypothetical protein